MKTIDDIIQDIQELINDPAYSVVTVALESAISALHRADQLKFMVSSNIDITELGLNNTRSMEPRRAYYRRHQDKQPEEN